MTTEDFSIEKLTFSYFDSPIDLEDKIYEGEGSCSLSDQIAFFQITEDSELSVDFDVYATGRIHEDKGDYWTPPYCDIEVDDVDITINEVYINGDEFKLNKESIIALQNLIKDKI
jgi:hypothetical protein